MEKTVLTAMQRFALPQGATVTVALSGGADSMSLLYCLLNLRDALNIKIEAAHFNHLIRGQEALRDQQFVKEQCEKLGVILHYDSADVPEYAKKKGISIELAARELRYSFLSGICKNYIATAHTASDNLETVILNLARGTSLSGLCGIPPKRDIYIRPLLDCTREQVEEYCSQNSIPFVTDSTNLSDDYTRNKIRHKIVPQLKELNPAVEMSVLRTSRMLREDNCAFIENTRGFLKKNSTEVGLCTDELSRVSSAVGKRVIKEYIENQISGIELESKHIDLAYSVALTGGSANLPNNMCAVCKNDLFCIKSQGKTIENVAYDLDISFVDYENLSQDEKINNLLLNNLLDCDKIVGKWVIRKRMAGDSIRLKNRGCTKTLNKIFGENKIPVGRRDILPIIADDKGVIWVCGIGVADRCAVTEKTKQILKICVIKRGEV